MTAGNGRAPLAERMRLADEIAARMNGRATPGVAVEVLDDAGPPPASVDVPQLEVPGPPEQPEEDGRTEPTRPRLRASLLTVSGLSSLPPVRPLIDGLVYRSTLAQVTGAPGSFKSFLAVGMACSVALGVPFEQHDVPDGGGPVVYVAAEGASGLHARILAWCHLAKVDPRKLDGRLYVLPVPVQLGERVDVAQAVEIADEVSAALLVLDTRARCTVGLEENSSTEQGKAIHAVERLIRATGCAVLPVHHAGRVGSAPRGSNSWDGAVWSDLRITSEAMHATVTCHKHKDVPDGCEHVFRMVPATVPEDLMPEADERQRSTLVAVAGEGRPSGVPDGKTGQIVRDIVRLCAGPSGLTRSEIRDMAMEKNTSKSQTYAAINTLLSSGVLRNVSDTKTERFALAPGLGGQE